GWRARSCRLAGPPARRAPRTPATWTTCPSWGSPRTSSAATSPPPRPRPRKRAGMAQAPEPRPRPRSAPAPSATIPFVGLTGGIGAGKSEALAALERLGAATLSTDAVVHELYSSPEVRDAVVERWGSELEAGDGVDRAAVARAAFASPADRAWLEGLLWPRVGARIGDWREELGRRRPPPRAAVVEVPLL